MIARSLELHRLKVAPSQGQAPNVLNHLQEDAALIAEAVFDARRNLVKRLPDQKAFAFEAVDAAVEDFGRNPVELLLDPARASDAAFDRVENAHGPLAAHDLGKP